MNKLSGSIQPTRTDVLVVGAGPAGSSAARIAAAAGLGVIVIDRRQLIGWPVQCAEYIPAPLGAYASASGVKIQSIIDMVSEYNFDLVETHASRGIMVDRAQFDQALVQRAQRAGASLWIHCCLVALHKGNRQATVVSSKQTLQIDYKILIAADGPKSKVAKLLQLEALASIHTRQYTLDLHHRSESTKVWLASCFPGGYAWLFPRGEQANLGVGFYAGKDACLKQQLDQLHQQQQAAGIVGDHILSRTGGCIPVAGMRDPLAFGEVLFAGDAAGLTHPISGAGIAAAVVSGEMAGEAAALCLKTASESALLKYEQDLRDLFEPSLLRAVQKRNKQQRYWKQDVALTADELRETWIF